MLKENQSYCEGTSLPPGILQFVNDLSPEGSLYHLVGCPIPPNRPDLESFIKNTTESYIDQQIQLVNSFLIESEDKPKDIDDDTLFVIGAYTLESSIYRLLNGWINTSNRSLDDIKFVAPYLKLLIQSLRKLPESCQYKGFGVRVLDASIPILKSGFDDYKNHFSKGRPVNFYSVCSFGRDENLLNSFLDKGDSKPVIVLKCDNLVGYIIENISMIPRLGGKTEGEVIVEAPSFFKVIKEPLKIKNYIIVEIEYDFKKSQMMAYLPIQKEEPKPTGARQERERIESERKVSESLESENKERGIANLPLSVAPQQQLPRETVAPPEQQIPQPPSSVAPPRQQIPQPSSVVPPIPPSVAPPRQQIPQPPSSVVPPRQQIPQPSSVVPPIPPSVAPPRQQIPQPPSSVAPPRQQIPQPPSSVVPPPPKLQTSTPAKSPSGVPPPPKLQTSVPGKSPSGVPPPPKIQVSVSPKPLSGVPPPPKIQASVSPKVPSGVPPPPKIQASVSPKPPSGVPPPPKIQASVSPKVPSGVPPPPKIQTSVSAKPPSGVPPPPKIQVSVSTKTQPGVPPPPKLQSKTPSKQTSVVPPPPKIQASVSPKPLSVVPPPSKQQITIKVVPSKLPPPSDDQAVALYDFEGEDDTELSLKEGEKILVLEKSDPWWRGRNKFGKEGLFPYNYVECSVVPPKQQLIPSPPTADHVVALYDFEGQDKTEISFKEGEKILVLEKSDSDWWRGRNKSGKEGLFPMNYVDSSVLLSKFPPPSAEQVVALYDFEGEDDTELSFKEGEKILLLEKSDPWWRGRNKFGKEGLFPFNYVEITSIKK